MNWKEEAVEKLRSYELMRRALENLPREIARLEEESKNIRTSGLSPLTGSVDPRGREMHLLNNIVRRQELSRSLEQTRQWMQTVSGALAALGPEERGILHRLYIVPKMGAVEDLCEDLQLEKSSIYRRRDAALRKFTLAMYGALESN